MPQLRLSTASIINIFALDHNRGTNPNINKNQLQHGLSHESFRMSDFFLNDRPTFSMVGTTSSASLGNPSTGVSAVRDRCGILWARECPMRVEFSPFS